MWLGGWLRSSGISWGCDCGRGCGWDCGRGCGCGVSRGGAGAEITGSFFSRGLALALDVGAEEVEVTTAATGWGLGMGRAKGTSVLSSRLRSSPDTFGTLAAFASGLSFKVGPCGETRKRTKRVLKGLCFLLCLVEHVPGKKQVMFQLVGAPWERCCCKMDVCLSLSFRCP